MPQFVNTTRVDSVLQLARLLHLFERDAAAAEPLYREAVSLARALKPGDHAELASALNEHAQVLLELDRAARRGSAGREALAMWRRLDGGKSEDGLASAQMLADIVSRLGKDDEAEKLYRDALALGVAALREPHATPDRPARRTGRLPGKARGASRGGAAASSGAAQRAWRSTARTIALVARALTGMGDHHMAAGAFEEAERLYRRAVTVRQNIHPAPHWRIAEARARVGYALFRQQRYQEAETLLTESYTRLQRRHRRDSRSRRSRARLAHRTLRRLGSSARRRPLSRGGTAPESPHARLAWPHGPR